MLLTRDSPQNKGHIQTETEGLEKDISYKWRPKKKKGVAKLISDKIDFKIKNVKRDKKRMLHNDQRINQEEDTAIINIYAPNIGTSQYVRQMLTSMKGEVNNNTIIVGDFNTPLITMDRSIKHKIRKETNII